MRLNPTSLPPAASLLLVFLACQPLGRAQTVLLGWDVNGTSEDALTLTATTRASQISSSGASGILSRGSGAALPGVPSSNAFGASGFTATSLTGAMSGNDYFSFSITVNDGYSLSLTSISMKMSDTTNGPTSAALFSSVGGFSSTSSAIQTWSLTGNASNDQTITLSSGAFTNLTGTVEFRLYGYGGDTGTTDKLRFRNLAGNDLALCGTLSAVPEPSTYAALTGAAVFAVTAWRRRRQRPVAPPQKSPPECGGLG
ncbi:MAG: PEP-CTERM sorting domain-containing protein [Opitutae bacterium]|nr:PEP-CTERM sorting domain-containing protein [Opitutae bacterium]